MTPTADLQRDAAARLLWLNSDPLVAFVAAWQADHEGCPCPPQELQRRFSLSRAGLEAYLELLEDEQVIRRVPDGLGGRDVAVAR
jgi:hypothetical protein